MVPVAPSRMVWRFLRCSSKQGVSSLCLMLFSCLFCLLGRGNIYAELNFNQMSDVHHFFGCMSLGFITSMYQQGHLLSLKPVSGPLFMSISTVSLNF